MRRHIIGEIENRNWLALIAYFLVIVAAVFGGLQLSSWNDARIASAKAEQMTERLLADLRQEAWIYDYIIAYQKDVLASADLALRGFKGDEAVSNDAFLISAYRASQYTWWNRRRAGFDDLVSSGAIDLIADAQLRKVARSVYGSPLLRDVELSGAGSPYRAEFRMTIPTDLHRALGDVCGDGDSTVGDYATLSQVLNYPCALDLQPAQIDEAVLALKENAALVPALRLRIATLETQLADLTETREIKELFEALDLPLTP